MVMFFSHLNCFHLSGQTLRDTSATHEAKVTPVNCFNSLLVREVDGRYEHQYVVEMLQSICR